jgi:hypothetical protein
VNLLRKFVSQKNNLNSAAELGVKLGKYKYMKLKISSLCAIIFTVGCASGPTYKTPPVTVEFSKVSSYWSPKRAITEKDIKIFSGPQMGCRAVYLEKQNQKINSYIDVLFTIDSKGRQYDQEITGSSKDINLDAAKWALMFGLSPIYEFVPSPANYDNQPIISTKRLYLASNSPLCNGVANDKQGYSNQSINISK